MQEQHRKPASFIRWDTVVQSVQRSFGGICLLCKANQADTNEHIFASALGGTVHLKLLCTSCNNNVGGKLISAMKRDARLVIPVYYQLRPKLPDVAHKFLRGLPLVGCRNGKREALLYGPTGIEFPEGATEEDYTEIEPDLTAPNAPDAAFLLVAYEMAALAMGAPILDTVLNPLRAEILAMANSTDRVKFAHQGTGKLFHGAAIRCVDSMLTVDIMFFGSARFLVEVVRVQAPADWHGFVYSQDLRTGLPKVIGV
jgi:hypothetical protein